jgi:hypothetical protein
VTGAILNIVWWTTWPLRTPLSWWWQNFGEFIVGRVHRRQDGRVERVKFCSYEDPVYFAPMIVISLALAALTNWPPALPFGWEITPVFLMFVWWTALGFCVLTIALDINFWKLIGVAVTTAGVLAFSYVSSRELGVDFLAEMGIFLRSLNAEATSGFFLMSALFWTIIVIPTVVECWLNRRIELDSKYVQERRFMRSTARYPLFARKVQREVSDMLEWALLGAADVHIAVQGGVRLYRNVPGAGRRLSRPLDEVVDYAFAGSSGQATDEDAAVAVEPEETDVDAEVDDQ